MIRMGSAASSIPPHHPFPGFELRKVGAGGTSAVHVITAASSLRLSLHLRSLLLSSFKVCYPSPFPRYQTLEVELREFILFFSFTYWLDRCPAWNILRFLFTVNVVSLGFWKEVAFLRFCASIWVQLELLMVISCR